MHEILHEVAMIAWLPGACVAPVEHRIELSRFIEKEAASRDPQSLLEEIQNQGLRRG